MALHRAALCSGHPAATPTQCRRMTGKRTDIYTESSIGPSPRQRWHLAAEPQPAGQKARQTEREIGRGHRFLQSVLAALTALRHLDKQRRGATARQPDAERQPDNQTARPTPLCLVSLSVSLWHPLPPPPWRGIAETTEACWKSTLTHRSIYIPIQNSISVRKYVRDCDRSLPQSSVWYGGKSGRPLSAGRLRGPSDAPRRCAEGVRRTH